MPHGCVLDWRMMFGKIIRFVSSSWVPVNEEFSLACSIFDPIESNVHFFGFFCLTLEFTIPNAVRLSVYIGVGVF